MQSYRVAGPVSNDRSSVQSARISLDVCVARATDHSCRIAIAGGSVLVYDMEVQQELRLRPPSTLGFSPYFVTRPGNSVCGVDAILRAADFTLDGSTFGRLSISDALAESVRTLLCSHCCVSSHCIRLTAAAATIADARSGRAGTQHLA